MKPTRTQKSAHGEGAEPSQGAELAEVRKLLLGEERGRLDRLERRTISAEAVADVLPDAILSREGKDDRVARALAPTVEAGLFRSARKDPQALADAIHPALGPAIRSMIQASLRQSLESLNVALENSLSPKGIGWRIEAARTGKSFSEVVLLKTLVFRVDQVLLVDRDTGLIMAEVHPPGIKTQDADMVAGMLSAISDFAADSFGASPEESPLEEIEFQGMTLILAQGPEAVLALVVQGNPPRTLHERTAHAIESLHVEYGTEMNEFDGNSEALAPLHPVLEDLLEQEARGREPNRLIRIIPIAVAALLLAWGVTSTVRSAFANRDLDRVATALSRTPGLVVTDARLDAGAIVVEGLIDPLVKAPQLIAMAALGESQRKVKLKLAPFTSLDEAIVVQRLRRLVKIPVGVALELYGGKVRVSGLDPGACEVAGEALRALKLEILGIEGVMVRP